MARYTRKDVEIIFLFHWYMLTLAICVVVTGISIVNTTVYSAHQSMRENLPLSNRRWWQHQRAGAYAGKPFVAPCAHILSVSVETYCVEEGSTRILPPYRFTYQHERWRNCTGCDEQHGSATSSILFQRHMFWINASSRRKDKPSFSPFHLKVYY